MEPPMQCPECQSDNPVGMKFCVECGSALQLICSQCNFANPSGFKFCGECGGKLESLCEAADPAKENKSALQQPSEKDDLNNAAMNAGERKHVTVLFSDLSGYTAMNEKLDPEEVKKILSLIFNKITRIVSSYDGFIEKYIGDAVMAVFGVPKAHEDDPIRAIRAALEIHSAIESLSPKFEKKIGSLLRMHTGINSGLVVTGKVDVEKGTQGLTGDTINLASRLEGIAKAGEIVVGPETYKQTLNYFEFTKIDHTKLKGKQKTVSTYKVNSVKKEPFKIHRLRGLRAALTGRTKEMATISDALKRLEVEQGSIISISGEAGTGKSRLKRELKDALNSNKIQWREGHAYSYTQNVPYFPLINLLTNAFQIEEGDRPDTIRSKVETGVSFLLGRDDAIIPYVGSLFALKYPEVEEVSREHRKDKLQEAIQVILTALIEKGKTIVCFEDLHWADPSFIELYRRLLRDSYQKALFICTYRPSFSLFGENPPDSIKKCYHSIRLKDLEARDAEEMLSSLLGTKSIPGELHEVVQQKAEGNPFYIEEIINSLIEREILTGDNGNWKLSRKITEDDIPATIQGVLTARIDRLGDNFKRVLKEASVIGRAFLYRILSRISDIRDPVDEYLAALESLDLIRVHALEPDIEYIFKHALTQETVYEGILKEERSRLHERIGLAIEHLFPDRLSEFYETLAFHFQRGQSFYKALDYLIKSGEKCMNLYSLQESGKFFQTAFDMVSNLSEKTQKDKEIITDILIKWSYLFYYNGHIDAQYRLLSKYEGMVDSLKDKYRCGMFQAWVGWTLWMNGKPAQAHRYLAKALEIGEENGEENIIGYACTWLSWCHIDFGEFEKAKEYSLRASKLALSIGLDHYCYFKPLGAIGQGGWFTGDWQECMEIGSQLLAYGKEFSESRCLVMGYMSSGMGEALVGKFGEAIRNFENAANASRDPFYFYWARGFLGTAYLLNQQVEAAENPLADSFKYCYKYGGLSWGNIVKILFGLQRIFKGRMSEGLSILKEVNNESVENNRKTLRSVVEYFLGKVYQELVAPSNPVPLSVMLKNCFFLIKNMPFAAKLAEKHLLKAIEISRLIGANQIEGQALIDLGRLYKFKKRMDESKDCLSNAVRIFKKYKNEFYINQAESLLL